LTYFFIWCLSVCRCCFFIWLCKSIYPLQLATCLMILFYFIFPQKSLFLWSISLQYHSFLYFFFVSDWILRVFSLEFRGILFFARFWNILMMSLWTVMLMFLICMESYTNVNSKKPQRLLLFFSIPFFAWVDFDTENMCFLIIFTFLPEFHFWFHHHHSTRVTHKTDHIWGELIMYFYIFFYIRFVIHTFLRSISLSRIN